MREFAVTLRRLDWPLIGAVLLLQVIGLLNLMGVPQEEGLLVKQVIFVLVGIGVLLFVAGIDYRTLRASTAMVWALWGLGVLLLGGVALFGANVRGAANWLIVGSLSVDPIEIVKFGSLLVLAQYFARAHTGLVFLSRVVLSGAIMGIPVAFALLQPDLGSAVILAALWFWMIVLLRVPLKTLVLIVLVAAALLSVGWNVVLYDYQKDRLTAFINPDADPLGAAYQTRQAVVAIGSGGVTGKGYFADDLSARLDLLPESANDFAFASLVEQGGLLIALLMLTLFAFIFIRIARVANLSTNNFSSIYAMGFLVLLTTQVALHIGMNIGMLPVTGLSLPFVSYGGSQTLTIFAMLGLLQSIRLNQPQLRQDMAMPLDELSFVTRN